MNYGSWEYLSLFSCSLITHVNFLLEIGIFLLLIAVITKSNTIILFYDTDLILFWC